MTKQKKDAKVFVTITFGENNEGDIVCRARFRDQYEVLENVGYEELEKKCGGRP